MSEIMSCERFEERLADYMEGDVRDLERGTLDAHAATCTACAELVSELRAITSQAATLGPIDPPASVWAGIESRIAADVVPITSVAPGAGRTRRVVPLSYGIAASLAMMAATSGITYVAMKNRDMDAPAPATMVAQGARPESTTTSAPAGTFTPVDPSPAGAVAQTLASSGTRTTQTPATVVRARRERPSAGTVYDSEIARLQTVLKERRSQLDPKTVAALEQSMQVIDGAIEQARAALAADPASRFLNHQLNGALDKKMQLLRTAAMLPSA
jgi:hypothetical protein